MKNYVNRLYKDLAWLWPHWEDVEEYRKESELFAGSIVTARTWVRFSFAVLTSPSAGIEPGSQHVK